MLDADERLTPAGRAEMLACDPEPETLAYSVPRKNFFCGRWIRGAGWWPDRLLRLFRTGVATVTSSNDPGAGAAAVHERWEVDGAVAALTEPIEHHSYPSVDAYRRKFARYTALEAAGIRSRVSLASLAAAGMLVPVRMAWLLFVRGGVFDGWRGAYVSVGSACYSAVARWKAWRR